MEVSSLQELRSEAQSDSCPEFRGRIWVPGGQAGVHRAEDQKEGRWGQLRETEVWRLCSHGCNDLKTSLCSHVEDMLGRTWRDQSSQSQKLASSPAAEGRHDDAWGQSSEGSASVAGQVSHRLNISLVLPKKANPGRGQLFPKNVTLSQNKVQNIYVNTRIAHNKVELF